MRAQFIFSEIGIGLRRNLTMTVAVVVTTAISLFLLGGGLMIQRQVSMMKSYYANQLKVEIFLCYKFAVNASCGKTPATDAQKDDIENTLNSLRPLVEDYHYVSHEQAFQIYKELNADSPDVYKNVTPDTLPESYVVKLQDPKKFEVIQDAMAGKAGVDYVRDQRKILDKLFDIMNSVRWAAFIICAIVVVAAALLIGNTIRISAFSRRRETGIMRLVGASNTYIQLPFVLEGVLAGVVGAVVGSGLLAFNQWWLVDRTLRPSVNQIVGAMVNWGDYAATVPWLFVVAIGVAGIASFVTLRLHMRV